MSDDQSMTIHPSLRSSFVPLPSDPATPLTLEELQALFSNPEAWREIMILTLQQQVPSTSESNIV